MKRPSRQAEGNAGPVASPPLRAVAAGAGLNLTDLQRDHPEYAFVAYLAEPALLDAVILDCRPEVVLLGEELTAKFELLARRHPGVKLVPVGQPLPGGGRERTPPVAPQPAGVPLPQQLVVVWSPKGGVGKTFIASNLATAVARRSRFSVALLDLDLHSADTGVYLDLLDGPGIVDLLPYLAELRPEHLENYMIRHPHSGLLVLLGPARPELADFVRLEHVLKILELARRRFGCVFVDMPPHAGEELVYECMEQASRILVVTTQDAAALRQTRLTLEVMAKLKIDVAGSVWVVLNRLHGAAPIGAERVEDFLGRPVVAKLEEDRKAVELSQFEGRPLVETGRSQRLGAALDALAQKLCPGVPDNGGPSRGGIKALFRRG
ncbi:MAG TPA: hypothetical protein DCM14_01490 [Clostridiales bacterium UBA8153]|nr:hypothetical protein [Clostridiales bacterium UBA8153]